MLEPSGPAKRVTIVLRSLKGHGGYVRLLEELRKRGAAEATALQGVASFAGQNPVHTNRVADFVPDLPVIVIWIDRTDTVERILPEILPLIGDGIVTVDDTNVVLHTSTEIGDLPPGELVRDVMTRAVESVRPEANLASIVTDLLRRKLRAVPVIDDASRVVGIISNGDLVRRGELPLRLELLQAVGDAERAAALETLRASGLTAGQVMTPAPVVATETTPIREAASAMLRHHLKRLPVVDGEGKLCGIVSRVDLLRTVTGQEARQMANGRPAPHESATAPITQVMSKDVPVVRPDDPVPHLVNVVVSTRLNRAVVVDDERRPIGVVSDAELIERVTPEARGMVLTALMRRLPLLHGSAESQATLQRARGKTARDFMGKDFVIVSASTTIGDALRQMLDQSRKIVVVVDADGRLLGMTDRRDLLSALA